MAIVSNVQVASAGQADRPSNPDRVPALENGDRLSLAEFERRYTSMLDVKKAELIQGVVHMGSPVRHNEHGGPHLEIAGLLMIYKAHTPGVDAGDNSSVRIRPRSVLQPDLLLRLDAARGGQCVVAQDGYLEGAPELVFEIAASSVGIDSTDKLNLYERGGTREYLIWRTEDRQIDCLIRVGERLMPYAFEDNNPNDIYKSAAFPGVWFDFKAILEGRLTDALATLNAGIASEEHRAFVNSFVKELAT